MKPVTQQTYRHRVLRVLLHIQEHLHEDPSLDELAAVACFSPFHFHRVFKAMVGEPVREHVRRLRLEAAAAALKQSDRDVTAIAFDAGYDSLEGFTRAFKAMFGLPPSQFRADRRAALVAATGSPRGHDGATGGFEPAGVRVADLPPMRVVSMRHVGPYQQCGETFDRFMTWFGVQGLFGPDTLALGVCHDDPDITPADKVRYDCCATISESDTLDAEAMAEAGVAQWTIPGGPHAVLTHEGPYERLGEAYGWLFGRWLPVSGREPGDAPCFECYHNDPHETAEEELLTDVYLPLR